MLNEQLFEETI